MKYDIILEKKYGKDVLTIISSDYSFVHGSYGGDYESLSDFHKAVKGLISNGHEVEYK